MSEMRIGVVGDLHSHWDEIDVALLDRCDYDLLYFTGDLGGGTPGSSLRIAQVMSRLSKPTLVMPGNNDTWDIAELAAELGHRRGIRRLAAIRAGDANDQESGVRLCGYSLHRLRRGAVDVTVIAARPHSLGGSELSFPEHMLEHYGVRSIDDSRDRLVALVDAAETEHVIFFAHNGPSGLGDEPHDMWGCDFKPAGGDWGDPDLAAAVEHATSVGKSVLAVVAGHMHLYTKGGRERPWHVEREGIRFINAARVPRIFARDAETHRHHVELTIAADGVRAREVYLTEG